MRELILDQGSEFGAHRIRDDGSWSSDFKDHLEKYGILRFLRAGDTWLEFYNKAGRLRGFKRIVGGQDIIVKLL